MILHILAPTFLASLMSFHSSSCCNHRDEYSKPLTLYTQIKLWFSFCYTLHLQYFRRFLPMSQIFTHVSLSSIGPSQISLGESIETMICVVLYYIYLIKSIFPFRRLWTPWLLQNGNHIFSSWFNQCSVQVPSMQPTLSNCFLELNWSPVRSRLAKLYHRNSAKLYCGKGF